MAGKAGWAASMAAGIVDPISLSLMLIPGLGEVNVAGRAAKIGGVIATNVAAGEAQQYAERALKEVTAYTDNILLSRRERLALLAGVLGALTNADAESGV